jgi:hypothetical protein
MYLILWCFKIQTPIKSEFGKVRRPLWKNMSYLQFLNLCLEHLQLQIHMTAKAKSQQLAAIDIFRL